MWPFRKRKPREYETPLDQYNRLIARGVRPGDASIQANYHPVDNIDHYRNAGVCAPGMCTPSRDNIITGYTPDEQYFDEQWHAAHHGRVMTDAEQYAQRQGWTPDSGLTRDLHVENQRLSRDDIEISTPERHALPAPQLHLPDGSIRWEDMIGHWVRQSDGVEYFVEE